jgi:hypothetical protein
VERILGLATSSDGDSDDRPIVHQQQQPSTRSNIRFIDTPHEYES